MSFRQRSPDRYRRNRNLKNLISRGWRLSRGDLAFRRIELTASRYELTNELHFRSRARNPSRTKDRTMLVLSRKKDEKIIIGDNISIMIVDIQGDKVRLGIDAPREVTVHREEVYQAIRNKQQEPVTANT